MSGISDRRGHVWVSSPTATKNQAAKHLKSGPLGPSQKENDGPSMDSLDIDPASNGLPILNNASVNGMPFSRKNVHDREGIQGPSNKDKLQV